MNVLYDWFDNLEAGSVNLGSGKCQLYVEGRYDSMYRITVPTESPEVMPKV